MPVIYIDVLFATNFMVDFLLLWSCGKLSGMKIMLWRLLLGAVFGGIYSVCVFFPELSMLYLVVVKLAASAVMLLICFPFRTLRDFFRTVLAFYGVNFILGGCITGLYFFTNIGGRMDGVLSNGSLYFNLPLGVLLGIALGVSAAVAVVSRSLRRRLLRQGLICRVTIVYREKAVKLDGLFDTGNCLTEPMTGRPVMVSELSGIEKLFPSHLLDSLRSADLDFISQYAPEHAARMRLIPYTAVGMPNGMLLSFQPDMVLIESEGAQPRACQCMVAIAPHKLKGYKLILHPDIIC